MMFLPFTKNRNVFACVLDVLNVKHTKRYSNKLYNEHLHKYNLFGLSKMLSEYNIHNIGVKTGDKEDNIFDIEVPFIAHIGEFVVVTKITATDVFYIWRDKNVKLPINEFIEAWSGVVLLVEKNDNSIEPDYQQNKKRELIHNFFNAIFLLSVPFFILYMYFNNAIYSWGISLLLITNFIGVYLSYLFVLKQFHIQNEYADKICSLFSQRHIKLYY